jgi:Na+/H+ antiporter NhaD/arsenite permease-like protein
MPVATPIEYIAAGLFVLALIHTFSTGVFERLAHTQPRHAGVWHLLGEVEVVFGLWAAVLVVAMFAVSGARDATEYVDTRNYTEPLFVFSIMVIAASRPVLNLARGLVQLLARALPLPHSTAVYFVALAFVPLLGSFVTEPAAMTIAALILGPQFFARELSTRQKYATLGVLFVNVSIGGTLTPFAAPPVLMVAAQWDWGFAEMLGQFGWKAALAVLINAAVLTFVYRRALGALDASASASDGPGTPRTLVLVHLLLLGGVVGFAHHPPIFLALLLFFLGLATAYPQYQDRIILREAMLVAFFLAGLVVLGGMQRWWLEPVLTRMDAQAVFFGAVGLTAITDNAALTYLASLVPGLSEEFKYAIVAGAVTGGGLTVIANAPNPAGFAILREHFEDGAIKPLGLLAGAALPTVVAMLAFTLL